MKNKLTVKWSKRENDLESYTPPNLGGFASARYLLFNVFNTEFIKEMTDRGYDVTTLRFSIAPQKGNVKFASERPEGMTSQEAWDTISNKVT